VLNATAAQNPVALGQLQAMGFIANALIGVTSIISSLTFTRNAATKWLHIRACGGGGGGGGAPYTDGNNQASGGGGFSGQYIELWITAADFGASVDIVIGAGGTAPSSAAGGSGGTTTIGSLVTLLGGGGGFGASWGSIGEILPQISTDTPPSSTEGIVVFSRPTTAGRSPMITFSKSNGKSGDGGDTPLGTGGPGNGLAGAGANGTGYGSGGSGASVGYNQSVGQAGGQGMPGVVIIEEYA
ncbi:glycine-rich domain-containing protein, partial [Komagataeibacter nataicola]